MFSVIYFFGGRFSKNVDLKNLKWNVLLQIGWYSEKKRMCQFYRGKKK
jgi:hypothetical protein